MSPDTSLSFWEIFVQPVFCVGCDVTNKVLAWAVLPAMYVYLQLEEGKKLVRDAIAAGVFNDLGSGSYIDICVITKDGVDYLRPYDKANLKGQRFV